MFALESWITLPQQCYCLQVLSNVSARLRCSNLSRCWMANSSYHAMTRKYLSPPCLDVFWRGMERKWSPKIVPQFSNNGTCYLKTALLQRFSLPLWYSFADTEPGNSPYFSIAGHSPVRKVIKRMPSKEGDSSGTDCWRFRSRRNCIAG